jgi:hypothetical protein
MLNSKQLAEVRPQEDEDNSRGRTLSFGEICTEPVLEIGFEISWQDDRISRILATTRLG